MVSRWEEEWTSLGAIAGPMRPYGKQLTPIGWDAFAGAMPEALASHDDDWLREQISDPRYWDTHLTRRTKQGVKLVDYKQFPLQLVVDGHRARYWPQDKGDRSVFSVPSGPNCHHSIKAVDA